MSDASKQIETGRTLIPKRIIQTGKALPNSVRIRSMVASVRHLNPDFEYLFFDDAQVVKFIDNEFPQYRAVFDSFRFPIQKFDFFRYLAVYRFGGFYFDLDILLGEPLADLCHYECIFPFEGLTFSRYLRSKFQMDWEIGNYAFGAAPNHPFLGAVIENCIRGQKDPQWVETMLRGVPPLSKDEFYVLYSTGPGLVTRTLAENPALARSVKVLMPEDVCDPANWSCFGKYGVHLMDGSWRMQTGNVERRFIRSRIAKNWELWKFRALLRESTQIQRVKLGSLSTE